MLSHFTFQSINVFLGLSLATLALIRFVFALHSAMLLRASAH
jgi:hypothetical protein